MKIRTLFENYIKLREKLDQAKIYKITDNTDDKIYIGSTCESLKIRLTKHKCDYKRFLKGLCNNVKSFDIIKNNDYKIDLLEDCNIKTKQELIARERYDIENNECTNKGIPGRTRKEYYIDNRDKIIEKTKEYYNENKEKIKQKFKVYREANKDKNKTYREANKNKLQQKFDCQCGGQYTFANKSVHQKSQKHQNHLESKI